MPRVQVSNLKGTLTVNPYEFYLTFRETFFAHLTKVAYDVLYEAVQLSFYCIRSTTSTHLRYCMRFEDRGLNDTFTCLVLSNRVFLQRSRTTNCYAPSLPETHQT